MASPDPIVGPGRQTVGGPTEPTLVEIRSSGGESRGALPIPTGAPDSAEKARGGKTTGKKSAKTRQRSLASFLRTMPVAAAGILTAAVLLVAAWIAWDRQTSPHVTTVLIFLSLITLASAVVYDSLRKSFKVRLFRVTKAAATERRRHERQIKAMRASNASVRKKARSLARASKDSAERHQATAAALTSLQQETAAFLAWQTSFAEKSQKQHELLNSRLEEGRVLAASEFQALRKELSDIKVDSTRLRERLIAGERQIGLLRYPDAPSCIVLFGHHKCGSRFFRFQVFTQVAGMTGARVRRYEIAEPPFHYSRMDDLDLCNIDFSGLGQKGRDVVLFANATERSLDQIQRGASSWKGLRVLRDPRQVLVSNYFHHKGNHSIVSPAGWVWDTLAQDRPILLDLPEEDGLLYELGSISKEIIEYQLLAPLDDERILTIKLEEFAETPRDHLRRIAEFLQVPEIAGVDFTRTGANRESGPWRHHFTTRIRDVFKERYGQALIDMGYEKDLNW